MRCVTCSRACLAFLSLLFCGEVGASAVFVLDREESPADKRNEYTNLLLREVLQKSQARFGAYTLQFADYYMERERLFTEMKTGLRVNVTAQATQPAWESDLIPIRIPVDKGVSAYRLFLINKQDQASFDRVSTLDELKHLRIGVQNSWASYAVYRELGFNIVAGNNYEGLFAMLMAGRSDYFPRAVGEIFDEYGLRKDKYPAMAVERSLIIYFPFPKYFFVSPAHPELARRIQYGLKQMLKDGSFDRFVMHHHRAIVEKSRFCSRRLIRFSNPLLSRQTPLGKPELWFNPYGGHATGGFTCRKDVAGTPGRPAARPLR